MISLILEMLGGAVVGGVSVYLLYVVVREIKKIHRVAKHYHMVAEDPDSFFGDRNHFARLQDKVLANEGRLYKTERDARNAGYQIDIHVRDNKHTKTAKAIKLAKERKKIEEGSRNEREFRGGDGM